MDFQYQPLASNTIRLLKPTPKSSSGLSFEIVHVPLSSNPHYAALSYTWGSPGNTNYAFLNKHPFPIRKNLYEALCQLQSSKWIDKYLWVDAICINQGTDQAALHERSVQITLMKQIYEQAEKVLVWLGKPENEDSNKLAFERIKYYRKVYLEGFIKAHPWRPWWWPNQKRRTHGDNVADALRTVHPAKDKKIFDVPGSPTYKAWLGIVSLWKQPWWTRTWIFQEATVPESFTFVAIKSVAVLPYSTKVRFLFGDQNTQWDALWATYLMATIILATPGLDATLLTGATDSFNKLLQFRDQRLQHIQKSFLATLQMFRHTDCFDPRDKVYAPLCVASQDVKQWIRPNYANKTTLDVYQDVVEYCLAQPGHELDFLGFAKYDKHTQTVEALPDVECILPSWMPNFAAPLDLTPIPKILHIPQNHNTRRVALYDKSGIPNYSGPTTAAYSPLGTAPSRSFIEHNHLHVSGVHVDFLKDMIPNMAQDTEAARAVAYEKARQWVIEANDKYPTGGTWADAMNRTMVLDVVYDYLGRPSERGNKHDNAFLKKSRAELSLTEYRYQMNMRAATTNALTSRGLGVSQKRFSLTIPDTAEIGDSIWAFSGGQALYILRETNRQLKQYTFIGECYAHGLMDGEIVRMLRAREANMEDISLV